MTVLLRCAEVCNRLGIGRTKLGDFRRRPDFPKPVWLTAKIPAFPEHEIDAFIQSLIAKRDGGGE